MRAYLLVLPLLLACFDGNDLGSLPPKAPAAELGARSAEATLVERQPVCLGSSVASAGALADTLYYRATRLPDGRIAVGYYAFFSEERPWGNNWQTWTVLPALAIDLFYTRTLFIAPGLQRAMFGAGDVEGISIIYEPQADGSLAFHHATAENANERPITLSREQAFALDPLRPTFYSEVWSHQLGGTHASSRSDLVYQRCYSADSIRPLPEELASSYRVENRAGPAHVERLGGTPLFDATGGALIGRGPAQPAVPAAVSGDHRLLQ